MFLIRVKARKLSLFRKNPKAVPKEYQIKNFFINQNYFEFELHKQQSRKKSKQGKYQRLSPKIRYDDIVIVEDHVEKWLEVSNNSKQIMLLPNDHQLTKLHATYIHEQGHLGVAGTIRKI